MKKRILSLILALSMVLSVLPLGAFAEGSTGGELVMKGGYPDCSNGTTGNGWSYDSSTQTLILKGKNREFDFSLANPQDTTNNTPADSAVKCAIESGAKITGGTFEGSVKNHWYITDGIFYGTVTNLREWFDGYLDTGMIQGGTFNRNVENNTNAVIENGTFNETVTNNAGYIYDGTFKGDVINNNRGDIKGGTFNKKVTNNAGGEISGGTFAGSVENKWNIYGGVFNGKTGLDGVTGVHSITWDAASPKAKITEVNGVSLNGSADWKPYVVVTEWTPAKTKVVTITADTDIYSLNGQPIVDGNCNSSYPDTSKKTIVKFTMPNRNVELGTGELVMENGYPVGTSGKGWSYDSSTKTLTLSYGTFDFSSTHPQGKTQGTSTTEPVKCAIQSYATITGGTFAGSVANGNTIENGTFNGTVTNHGTISDGTFTGQVDNKYIIKGGTFRGEVTNSGTITGNSTTFEKLVTNGGTINNGTFAAGLSRNDGSVTGGVFNGKTGLTDAHQVTVTNGSVLKVNDEAPRKEDGTEDTAGAWNLYSYAGTTMTITADTEIFSLNGQPIDERNYPNKNDKTTVKFTMPGENVGLSSGELVMQGGRPVGTSGKGWSYDSSTQTLTLTDGTYDFSYTYPQNSNGAGAEPVACAVETQLRVEITGGTFEGEVINNDLGEISGGTFHEKVSNYNGMIIGGTFKSSVTSTGNGRILGGVFNSKTTPKPATDAYSITLDAAYPNAKITEVNGVPTEWEPYVVVTQWTKSQEVTIIADAEIFSLNGQPIGVGNCNSSYDGNKNTVKFTMPDDDVVLNRTAELEVVGGEIKSGETAKGSGRVLIGGKVEVTTKDKAQDFVGWTIAPEGIELRDDDGREVDLTSEWTFSFMMPDVSGGKLTLKANYQPFRTSLLMNADGTVNLEHVYSETYDGNETRKGDGWNVFNRGTLILEKWTYDFRYTAPTEKTGTLEAVTCGVRNKGGTIENGVFRSLVLNEVGGTITGGTFAAGLIEMPGMTRGSVTGGVFNGKTGLTNAHHVTVTDGSLLKVNGEDPLNADETTGTVTPGTAWDLYAYAGTTVTITADTEIFSLNGQPIAESSYGVDKKTVTFTMPDDDVVLNKAITSTDLVMEKGYPKDSNGGKNPCKGDGWEYIPNDPTNGDMLLLTGSNQTGGLFDFSTIGDGSAVECNVFVGKPTAITGGEFNGKVFNNSGILGGTFHGEVDNTTMGTIEKGAFHGAVENNGMIENGTFHDEVKNNGTINDGAFNGKVENNSVINSGTFNGEVVNTTMGRIENGTFNDAVENNGTIENGTFNGAVENNGIIEKGTFNGAVTGSGTVSESITGSGTLNGELITKTPEPKPEPEPTTYTVTVIGGTIDGKTSVSAKENDTLTVVLDQNDIPDGMTFDMWSISSSKLSGDINVDYRAEAMTFQMPAEDVTIRAQYRSAEIIEDAAPSPLATAATIAVGGAAAGIVVWQGVSLGVDLYLTSALPQGVPVPTDRRALALLLWETAGKPEVALPTLYGDIPAEEIELQKATRWAVQNGLMDAADKKDASFFDPDHYVTKMDVFGAWLRLKKLLGTT